MRRIFPWRSQYVPCQRLKPAFATRPGFHFLSMAILITGLAGLEPCHGIAQDAIPQRIEVIWHSGKTVALPGVERVILLDDSLCNVQVSPDKVDFSGEKRGTSVAFIWVKGQRYTVVVSVILPPTAPEGPRLSQSELEALGSGMAASNARIATGSGAPADLLLTHNFNWMENNGASRLFINAQVENTNLAGAPWINATSASVQYYSPRLDLSLIDFPLNLTGISEGQMQSSPYTLFNIFVIRGADVRLKRGANQYEFFGGSTPPAYFLSLQGTRDTGGFTFSRHQSKSLDLFATSAWLNAPIYLFGPSIERQNSVFQTAGYNYHPNHRWAIQGTGGVSNRGGLVQQGVTYNSVRFVGFISGTSSSPSFPLNQMQMLFAGGTSLAAGSTLILSKATSGSFYYQHSTIKPAGLTLSPGTSDYLNPHFTFAMSSRENATFNYTYTSNVGGFTSQTRSHGNRYDFSLNSQLPRRTVNTAEVTVGSLSDPLQLNAESDLTLLDAVNIPIRAGSLNVGFQHSRNNPSLVSRMEQEINLLSPALQQLFLENPVAFVESNDLPPAIRSLLNNLQPTNTEVTLQGQFSIRNRLNLSPMVGYYRAAEGLGQETNSYLLGYNLTYRLTRTLQLQSSLSNMLLWDFRQQGLRRTNVFSIGIAKRLSGHESVLHPFQARRATIEGQVYRDNNVNGRYDAGEPGFEGVRVELNNGETALTDARGQFSFSGLKPDVYTVTLPVDQFHEPIRMTSTSSVQVDILQPMVARADFGIVNFARVMGNVFNDYDLTGRKQLDAPGIRQVRLTLSGGKKEIPLLSDSSGDYEIDDVSPGDYLLSVDASTIPPNYQVETASFPIHVAPTSTVVQDVPVLALRSIMGHVLMKPTGANGGKLKIPGVVSDAPGIGDHRGAAQGGQAQATEELVPLPGVRIAVDHTTVTTDQDGAFLLRNLPAGDIYFQILPAHPIPEGVKMPAWKVRMPRDPVFIQGATVTISNPGVIKCIVPDMPGK